MADNYTEEDLLGLSDEERKAVLEPDEDEPVVEEIDDADDVDDDDPEVEKDEEPEVEQEEDSEEPEDEPVKKEEPEAEKKLRAEKVIEKLVVKLPDELAESFSTQLADLQKQYDDGEIELSDLLNQRDKINRAIYNAEVEATEAANAKSAWESAQDVFLAGNPHYLDNKSRYADLNLCVKVVVEQGSAATFDQVLAMAKKMEEALNGKVEPEVKKAEEVKPKKANSPRPKVPALSELPASKANDDGGEFVSLDSLTGIDYENALAKLTPAQLDRYLK
jgi:hypothetical protein